MFYDLDKVKTHYEQQGVVIIDSFLSDREIEHLRQVSYRSCAFAAETSAI